MEPPLEAVPPLVAAVTMAVVRGAGSVREVMAAIETRSFRQTFDALREARNMGLVAWDDGRSGTLRPGLAVVAATPI
jgi:hypothetical protein